MSQQQTLYAAFCGVHARQSRQFLLDDFPFGQRLKQQAWVMDVNGANQLTSSVLKQQIPVSGWDG